MRALYEVVFFAVCIYMYRRLLWNHAVKVIGGHFSRIVDVSLIRRDMILQMRQFFSFSKKITLSKFVFDQDVNSRGKLGYIRIPRKLSYHEF